MGGTNAIHVLSDSAVLIWPCWQWSYIFKWDVSGGFRARISEHVKWLSDTVVIDNIPVWVQRSWIHNANHVGVSGCTWSLVDNPRPVVRRPSNPSLRDRDDVSIRRRNKCGPPPVANCLERSVDAVDSVGNHSTRRRLGGLHLCLRHQLL